MTVGKQTQTQYSLFTSLRNVCLVVQKVSVWRLDTTGSDLGSHFWVSSNNQSPWPESARELCRPINPALVGEVSANFCG
jgi:hypothetical protein